MKRILLSIVLLLTGFIAFSQADDEIQSDDRQQDEIKTLFHKGRRGAVGGYGELSLLYSQIDQRDALSFGARGGVLLGHMMTIGLCGQGFINDPKSYALGAEKVSISGGYGGFYFEPIILPRFPIHIAIPVTIGVGGVSYARLYDYNDYNDYYPEESDAFVVVEPGVELELNITRFCRFSVGAYYRYTTGIDMEIDGVTLPTDLLQGLSAGVNFKFGKF
jgi:hypothetical protein